MYLTQFSQTPETWANLIANPEDRRESLEPIAQAAGAKLHGFWYAFGEVDGYVLVEAPDDVVSASVLVKVASTGAFTKIATTKLLTVEEALDALRRASDIGYAPPSAGA
jgi:uncharacterized protein with GYD domain